MMRIRNDDKGIALIVVIVTILIVSIVALALAGFVANALPLSIMRANEDKALYAAEAGAYKTVYDYMTDDYKSGIRDFALGGNVTFSVNRDADYLLIDTGSISITATPLPALPEAVTLGGIKITNVNTDTGHETTVDRMQVAWSRDISSNLREVWLDGVRVENDNIANGITFDLDTPSTTVGRQVTTDNRWVFGSAIPSDAYITATFFCSDGSSRKAVLCVNNGGYNNEFSITSTGTAAGRPTIKRTIKATYDTGTNEITSWQEIADHI